MFGISEELVMFLTERTNERYPPIQVGSSLLYVFPFALICVCSRSFFRMKLTLRHSWYRIRIFLPTFHVECGYREKVDCITTFIDTPFFLPLTLYHTRQPVHLHWTPLQYLQCGLHQKMS